MPSPFAPSSPLPTPATQAPGPSSGPACAVQALPLRGLSILLVEDSRFASDALRLICTRSGARLRRAETLAAAARHLALRRPDLAIVDLGLPDGRGEWLIARCSGDGLPVLGISGDPDGGSSAGAAGARAFLSKPVAGIGHVQRVILQALGMAPPHTATEAPPALPPGDLLALRDDLERAAQLLTDPATAGYARGFLRGVAQTAGDSVLVRAADGANPTPALLALVRERLAQAPTLP